MPENQTDDKSACITVTSQLARWRLKSPASRFLFNLLFRRRSKKTRKLCVTGLCEGNSPVTGEFPAQRASSAENVSIWWRHYGSVYGIVPSANGDVAPKSPTIRQEWVWIGMKDGESTLHLFAFMFRNIKKIKQINKRNAKDVHAWFHPNKNTAKRVGVYFTECVISPTKICTFFAKLS